MNNLSTIETTGTAMVADQSPATIIKFSVSRDDLLAGLNAVQKAVATATTIPILSNALLDANENQGVLSLAGTDLDATIKVSIRALVKQGGSTTLPCKKLAAMVASMRGDDIDVSVNARNQAFIKCGPSKFVLHGLPTEEFPPTPVASNDGFTLLQKDLKHALGCVACAMGTDENRPCLAGALFSLKNDKLELVATNGHRLSVSALAASGEGFKVIVPAKSVHNLAHVLSDEGYVRVNIKEGSISFQIDEILMDSRLMEGSYPNYEQVIPKDSEYKAKINRKNLLHALEGAAVVVDDKFSSVVLKIHGDTLDVESSLHDIGESSERVDVEYAGEDITQRYNVRYLIDGLRHLSCDEVTMQVAERLMITAESFRYITMSMRLN